MSTETQSGEASVTPTHSTGGVTPPETPDRASVTPTGQPSPPDSGTRDADATGNTDRDADTGALDRAELAKALQAERRRSREIERELKRLSDAEKTRTDAEKTELERVAERAETAERRVAEMEREALSRQVAGEAGIPQLWHRLRGEDVRALRADAQRMREELGLASGALEGGVRSDGVPAAAQSMDDLIRGVGSRR